MEIALILLGLLIMGVAGLWYLGAAFAESLFWGLTLLGLSVSSMIFSIGRAGGAYSFELAVIFQVSYWILHLTFLYLYWHAVKRPFFLSIFGGIVFGVGIGLGGMSYVQSTGSGLLASLRPQPTQRPSQVGPRGPDSLTGTPDQDLAMFDAIAKEYEKNKADGMKLDPRYDQAVRDYQAMRGRQPGESYGPGGDGAASVHGGSAGPSPEPDPLIGGRSPSSGAGEQDFSVSSEALLAASQRARQHRGESSFQNPWYLRYSQATEGAQLAWGRVQLALHDPKFRKDLAPACKALFQSTKDLPRDLYNGAPDERISLNLAGAYDTLMQIGRDCMAGRLAAVQAKEVKAKQELERASNAMAPYNMTP